MPWGVIDVRECGAAGDAQTDDTAAILEAIERLPKTGGVLYFPPGLCCIGLHFSVNAFDT